MHTRATRQSHARVQKATRPKNSVVVNSIRIYQRQKGTPMQEPKIEPQELTWAKDVSFSCGARLVAMPKSRRPLRFTQLSPSHLAPQTVLYLRKSCLRVCLRFPPCASIDTYWKWIRKWTCGRLTDYSATKRRLRNVSYRLPSRSYIGSQTRVARIHLGTLESKRNAEYKNSHRRAIFSRNVVLSCQNAPQPEGSRLRKLRS